MSESKKFTPKEAALAVLKKAEELYKASTLAKGDWKKIHDKLEREGYSKESADKIDGSIKAKMGKAEDPLNSIAGDRVKRGVGYKANGNELNHKIAMEGAKDSHKERLEGIKNAPRPKLGKSDPMQKMGISEKNPDEKQDAALGEKVEHDVEQHEKENAGAEKEEGSPMEMGMSEKPMKGHIKLAKFMGRMEHKKSEKAKILDKGDDQMMAPAAPAAAPAPAAPAAAPMAMAQPKIGKGM